MATLEEQLAALKGARGAAELRVTYDGKSVEYRSIAELDLAISRVQNEIAASSSAPPARTIRTYAGRGV